VLEPGGRDRGDGLGPSAPCQLERDPAAERVARDVGAVEAGPPHLVLDGVGQRLGRRIDARRQRLGAPESGWCHVCQQQRMMTKPKITMCST
jgi:hypothetical protein